MFILSQIVLDKVTKCEKNKIPTYSVAVGLFIYGVIYVALMALKHPLLKTFNKFSIYIIAVDLLLSTVYHIKQNKLKKKNIDQAQLQSECFSDEISESSIETDSIVDDNDTEQLAELELEQEPEREPLKSSIQEITEQIPEDTVEIDSNINVMKQSDIVNDNEVNSLSVQCSEQANNIMNEFRTPQDITSQLSSLSTEKILEQIQKHEIQTPPTKKRKVRQTKKANLTVL